MCNFDLILFYCVLVGFDCMVDVMDWVLFVDIVSYFFYNIEKIGENVYCIVIVVVGFGVDDLNVEVKDGVVIVLGCKVVEDEGWSFLYCGIVICVFECCFMLVDYVCVEGVSYVDGMLNIDLVCEILELLKLCCIEIVKLLKLVEKLDV